MWLYRMVLSSYLSRYEIEIDTGIERWRSLISERASQLKRDGVSAVRRHSVNLLIKSQTAIIQSMTQSMTQAVASAPAPLTATTPMAVPTPTSAPAAIDSTPIAVYTRM